MFYLDNFPESPKKPNGYCNLTNSSEWMPWLICMVPRSIDTSVASYFYSNAKHIIVGLEMKAGLIIPHQESRSTGSVLFEPYFQIMSFEFCVGVFSLFEGLGSFIYLVNNGKNGSEGERVITNNWISAIVNTYDGDGEKDLESKLKLVKSVRDKMHQDKLGIREDIDWHSFDYDRAFKPALEAVQIILTNCEEAIPKNTNLLYNQ